MFYTCICTKFCPSFVKVSQGFRVVDLNSRVDARVVTEILKGHNSVKKG